VALGDDGPVIADLVADLFGGVLGGVLSRRSARQAAGRQPPVRIYAGLRMPGRRLSSRWRHGFLDCGPGASCSWVPRRPRSGHRIALPDLRVGRRRGMTFAERWWWLNPTCRVFAAHAGDDAVEIAVLQDDVGSLFAWGRGAAWPVVDSKPDVPPG